MILEVETRMKGLKTDHGFVFAGSVREFKFAANELLFWSAILLSPSD